MCNAKSATVSRAIMAIVVDSGIRMDFATSLHNVLVASVFVVGKGEIGPNVLYQRRDFLTRGGFPFWCLCDSRLAKEFRQGLFLLYDWARVPFGDYIGYRDTEPGDPPEVRYPRALEMFATHNKYTADDWRWILQVARYDVVKEAWPYVRATALLTRPS